MIIQLAGALLARLKARAATEGRSLNEFVVQALATAPGESTSRRAVRERARATGRLVVPEPTAGARTGTASSSSRHESRRLVSTLEEERSAP